MQVLKGTIEGGFSAPVVTSEDMPVWFQSRGIPRLSVINDKSPPPGAEGFPVPVWDFDFPH